MSVDCPTLNDIAGLIVQIEPTDLAGWAHVRSALKAFTGSSPPSVQKPIAEVVRRIDQMTEGKASDPSGLLGDIGIFIEEAIDAMEKPVGEDPFPLGSASHPASILDRAAGPERLNALPAEADPALLEEFVAESQDLVAGAEAALLELETDPENREAVNRVFRAFHTIKGTSVFLGLDPLSEFAHAAESFLSRVRDKEIRCTGGHADLAFRSVDMIKDLIKRVQEALAGQPLAPPEGLAALMTTSKQTRAFFLRMSSLVPSAAQWKYRALS